MRLPLVATLFRHRTILAALSATMLAVAPAHAQVTTQPAKAPVAKSTAAPVVPAKAPATVAVTQPPATKPVVKPATALKAKRVLVDINHATLDELKALPGVGDAYGSKIIAGRPYTSKNQLVSHKVLDAKLYKSIQGMIVAKK